MALKYLPLTSHYSSLFKVMDRSNGANRPYNAVPPDSLASGTQITINPITNGECVFIVPGDLKIQ